MPAAAQHPRSQEFILKVLRVEKRRQSLEEMAELSEEDDAEEKNNVAEDDLDFPEDNSKDQEERQRKLRRQLSQLSQMFNPHKKKWRKSKMIKQKKMLL